MVYDYMKVPKSLLYFVDNPISIVVNLLVLCILGSSLGTIMDDPFKYDTWEYLSRDINNIIDDLPWSFWQFTDVLSEIVDEAVRDFSYLAWLFFIPFALAITYRESVGSQKGMAEERKVWMEFYETQRNEITRGDELEIEHIAKDRTSDSYLRIILRTLQFMARNPLLFILHSAVWVYALAMFIFLFSLSEGIVEASNNFVESILQISKHAILFAIISSFREARGYLKGTITERQLWMEWYHRQIDYIEKGESISNPPPSKRVRSDSYLLKIHKTFRLIYSDKTHFGIQFAPWCGIFSILSLPSFGYSRNPTYISLIGSFVIPAMLITFLICYRKARGIIKGKDKEQHVWVSWCQQQKIAKIKENVPKEQPTLYEQLDDSYLLTTKKTVSIMLRNPIAFVFHLMGWIIAFIVLFGATNWFRVVEWRSDLTQILIVFTLAMISYYQETKGCVKGLTEERKSWTEWYNNQNQAETV